MDMHEQKTELLDEYAVDQLTERERHELFAAEQRRLTLEALTDRTNAATLSDVATDVAEKKYGIDLANDSMVREIKIALHHIHLPKLDRFGVLTYNPSLHRIEL